MNHLDKYHVLFYVSMRTLVCYGNTIEGHNHSFFEETIEIRYFIWDFYDALGLYIIFESLIIFVRLVCVISTYEERYGRNMTHLCVKLEPCIICQFSNLNK